MTGGKHQKHVTFRKSQLHHFLMTDVTVWKFKTAVKTTVVIWSPSNMHHVLSEFFPYNLTHFSVQKVTGQGQGQLTNKNHIFGHISTHRQVRANPFDLCGTLKGSLTPHIRTKQITRSIKMLRPFITWQVVTAMLQNTDISNWHLFWPQPYMIVYINKGYMIYGREHARTDSVWWCHMDLWSSYLPA